jgi:hypothetical protein
MCSCISLCQTIQHITVTRLAGSVCTLVNVTTFTSIQTDPASLASTNYEYRLVYIHTPMKYVSNGHGYGVRIGKVGYRVREDRDKVRVRVRVREG